MKKIMLVVEDFRELIATEALLRRLGFDVLSLAKEILVNDALLRFHPDMVLGNLKGRSVDGVRLAARVRKSHPGAKIVLLYPQGVPPQLLASSEALIDALLETPIHPLKLISAVAQLFGLPPEALIEKYDRFTPSRRIDGQEELGMARSADVKEASDVVMVKGRIGKKDTGAVNAVKWDPIQSPGSAGVARSERSDRYDQFLKLNDIGPVDGVLPREIASLAMQKLKKDSVGEKAEIDRIDASKREFAKVLFASGERPEGDDDFEKK